MDLLYKQLSNVGDSLYFIASSIENPYLFLRFRGELMEMTVNEDSVYYRIKPTEIFESITDIRQYIVGNHFRMKCCRKVASPYRDFKISGWNKTDHELVSHVIKLCEKNWFSVSMMTTFKTEEEMNRKMSLINKHTIDRLTHIVTMLSERSIKY